MNNLKHIYILTYLLNINVYQIVKRKGENIRFSEALFPDNFLAVCSSLQGELKYHFYFNAGFFFFFLIKKDV